MAAKSITWEGTLKALNRLELKRNLTRIFAFVAMSSIIAGVALFVEGAPQGHAQLAPDRSCNNPVSVSAPATNFAQTVANSGAGTCFKLQNGTYRFSNVRVKDNMIFEGASVGGVVIDGNGRENAFFGNSRNAIIRKMTFRNFNNGNSGSRVQEYSPIRGKNAIYAIGSASHAKGWIIDSVVSHGNYSTGLYVGDYFTVKNSKFYDNGVNGIGGDRFVGGLVESNEVYDNGAAAASGQFSNGAGIKFTWVDGSKDRLTIRNNEVHDQKGGIWCDLECNGVDVTGNNIYNHTGFGIFYELSRNAVFSNNTVRNSNTYSHWTKDWFNGCIATGESQGVVIRNNTIDSCKAALVIRETLRPAASESYLRQPHINSAIKVWTGANVTFIGNTVKNSAAVGLAVGPTGVGKTDLNTVKFIGNKYDNPNSMDFWWNRTKYSYANWLKTPGGQRDNEVAPTTPTPEPGPGPTTPEPVSDPEPETPPVKVEGQSTIAIRARGYTGGENMTLRINDEAVATFNSLSTDPTTYTHVVADPVTIFSLRVHFDNDGNLNGADKNIQLDYVEVDGKRYETEADNIKSLGVWTSATGCSEGFKKHDVMACNGWVEFQGATGSVLGATPANGAVNHPLTLSGATELSWDITPVYGEDGHHFYGVSTFFEGQNYGLKAGLHTNGAFDGTVDAGNVFSFDVQNATEGVLAQGAKGESLGSEEDGYGLRMLYDWKVGSTYKISVKRAEFDTSKNGWVWAASIQNVDSGETTTIGSIISDGTAEVLAGGNAVHERLQGDAVDCKASNSNLEKSGVIFSGLESDGPVRFGSAPAPDNVFTSAQCADFIHFESGENWASTGFGITADEFAGYDVNNGLAVDCKTAKPLLLSAEAGISGSYNVWVRSQLKSDSDTQLSISRGGFCEAVELGRKNEWRWGRVGEKLDLVEGAQNLELHLGEGEVWIDKVVLTVDDNCSPSDQEDSGCILEPIELRLSGVYHEETLGRDVSRKIHAEVLGVSDAADINFSIDDGTPEPAFKLPTSPSTFCLVQSSGGNECGQWVPASIGDGSHVIKVTASDLGRDVAIERNFEIGANDIPAPETGGGGEAEGETDDTQEEPAEEDDDETPPVTSNKSIIKVRARGHTGSETGQLQINGEVVATFTNMSSSMADYTHEVTKPTVISSLRFNFVNDNGKRDITLDYIDVDGQRYETESNQTRSLGIWTNSTRCSEGYKQSQFVACNGWVEFEAAVGQVLAGTGASGGAKTGVASIINVRARGYTGSENISLVLNDRTVAQWKNLSTAESTYAHVVDTPTKINKIQVHFTNDNGRRDVSLDYIEIGGVKYQTEADTVESKGIWTDETRCERGFKRSDFLACNGWADFKDARGVELGVASTVQDDVAKRPGVVYAASGETTFGHTGLDNDIDERHDIYRSIGLPIKDGGADALVPKLVINPLSRLSSSLSGRVMVSVPDEYISDSGATITYTVDGREVATAPASIPEVLMDSGDIDNGEHVLAASIRDRDGTQETVSVPVDVDSTFITAVRQWLAADTALTIIVMIGSMAIIYFGARYIVDHVREANYVASVTDVTGVETSTAVKAPGLQAYLNPQVFAAFVTVAVFGVGGFVLAAPAINGDVAYSGNAGVEIQAEVAGAGSGYDTRTDASGAKEIKYIRLIAGSTVPAPTPAPAPTPTPAPAPTPTPAPAPAPTPTTGDSSTPWNFYGNPWHTETLANLEVADGDRYSYRFVAKDTGKMVGIRNFFVSETSRRGYAKGDGGKYSIKLVRDNGSGFPDESQVLAETVWTPTNIVNGTIVVNGQQVCTSGGLSCAVGHFVNFARKNFNSPADVVAGEKYHVVFDNIHPNENANYMSLDSAYVDNGGHSKIPRSPLAPSIDDWGVTRSDGGSNSWREFTVRTDYDARYEGNMILIMEDGSAYGNSYIGGEPETLHTISGNSAAREIFTPTETHKVDKLSVGVEGSGTLRTTLTENGKQLGSWTSQGSSGWNHHVVDFSAITLQKGTQYTLTIKADSGSFKINSSRQGCNGLGENYERGGDWCDGYAQYNNGSGWSDAFHQLSDLNSVAFGLVTSSSSQQPATTNNGSTTTTPIGNGSTSSPIKIRAEGNQGDEDINLEINGEVVARFDAISANAATYTYQLSQPTTINSVRVNFTNDNGVQGANDRWVIVDYIEIGGTRYESEASNVRSLGVWTSGAGCSEGYKQRELIACDGWIEYEAAKGIVIDGSSPATSGGGADDLGGGDIMVDPVPDTGAIGDGNPGSAPLVTTGNYKSNLALVKSATHRNRNLDNSKFRNTPMASIPIEQLFGPRSEYLNNPGGNPEQAFPWKDGGQFRTACEFSHFAYDDPLVFPNEPGKSHLHMFFGNTDVNAYSTYQTLFNSGSSTCNGKELNRTSYWAPAMFDSSGNVRVPERVVVYYKGEGLAKKNAEPYAAGAAIIATQNINATSYTNGGAAGKFSFTCSDQFYGPRTPAQNTILSCDGNRYPHRDTLVMNVKFPQCWNGQDPSDWRNNYSVPKSGGWYFSLCEGTFNRTLPNMEYFIHYPIDNNETTSGWFLASDVNPTTLVKDRVSGSTVHADWWGGWNKEVNDMWINNCVLLNLSPTPTGCGMGYLTDGGPDGSAPRPGPALKYRDQYNGPFKIPASQVYNELCANKTRPYTTPASAAWCNP